MESLPLISKSSVVPNPDATAVIREIFQAELENPVPSRKMSENLRKSLEFERLREEVEGQKSFRSVCFLENLPDEKGKLAEYAENVFEAYGNHEEAVGRIAKAELNVMETHAVYLCREKKIRQDPFLRDLLRLKRHPLMSGYDPELAGEFGLLQGESGLPPEREAKTDFRVKDFRKWKKRVRSASADSLALEYANRRCRREEAAALPGRADEEAARRRPIRPRRAKGSERRGQAEVFRAEPRTVCFVDYEPGNAYQCRVAVQNVHVRPVRFVLMPPPARSPFRVEIEGTATGRILPGLGFRLLITFEPRSLDDENEIVTVAAENGTNLIIPVASYLEPPVLKTHGELDEFTKKVPERIRSSYIDCGPCFPGDSKLTKVRFHSFGGPGEFFLMNQENWSTWHVDRVTADNFTDIPPFRLYPTYFRLEKNQVIDLHVEFKPTSSGLHSDNVIIACNNGEIRNLDILGDGVAWNRAFISFEDSLEKDFPAHVNDDLGAAFYLDLGETLPTGRSERTFSVRNNSNVPFEFRWEMRDAVVPFAGHRPPGRLSPGEVGVEPSRGVFEPNASRTFLVSVRFEKRPVGEYRTVLGLYVVGLPYRSIEQASTVVRPSAVRRRRPPSESASGDADEESLLLSFEPFDRDAGHSARESGKPSEAGSLRHFPAAVCRQHSGICAVPLEKSKTCSNVGDEDEGCACTAGTTPDEESPGGRSGCGLDSGRAETAGPNAGDPGSDLPWDSVDVLVDEVEVWAEVVRGAVSVEPNIVDLSDAVRAGHEPVRYTVHVRNESRFPIACRWLRLGTQAAPAEDVRDRVRTLFHAGGAAAGRDAAFLGEDGEWEDATLPSSVSADSDDDYQVASYVSQRFLGDADARPDESADEFCEIDVRPGDRFSVPPASRFACVVSVAASEPGVVHRVLHLAVEDADQLLKLHLVGRVRDREFSVLPRILDFGTRRRGTRYEKHFKVRNESEGVIEWHVKQYRFDYEQKQLVGPLAEDAPSGMKRTSGVLEPGDCTIESYKLDARKPGLQTAVLQFELARRGLRRTQSKYLVVLADVQTPELAIEAPRFNTAILAPSGTMYVGQEVVRTITLTNMKNVGTTFVWGYPFGCHCRKLRLNLNPKYRVIAELQKVPVEVRIMPLEEGIVEHCYVPCFFSRSASPIVLSVVGVVKNLQVTFEMESQEANAVPVRIPWPIRNFDPEIGMTYLPERNVLDFVCHCDDVDRAYAKATGEESAEDDAGGFRPEEDEAAGGRCARGPCAESGARDPQTAAAAEWPGDGGGSAEEEPEEETCAAEGSDRSAVVEYPEGLMDGIDLLYYAASEMEFLNVLSRTVAVKHFVIRNETPIRATFSLRARYFGKGTSSEGGDGLEEIRDRVFGRTRGELEGSLIYGQPLVVATSPSEGTLDAYDSVRVGVFVYGNTWGEYRDFIFCEVSGMAPFVVKVFVRLSGHPVVFPTFNTSLLQIPVLRFDTVGYRSNAVSRSVRVRNSSSIPITVTWMVFLTSPLPEEARDGPFNLCLDLYTDKESEDPDKGTKSSRNYLSKNTSGTVPLLDVTDVERTSSRCTGPESTSEVDSPKKDSSDRFRGFNGGSEGTPTFLTDSTKPEVQLLENYGKMDLHVFQVFPRELDLDPYSEQKLTVTFDPSREEREEQLQEFEAVVTGCVRLRQEFAHYPDIYRRACGKDYVSKLLRISAAVERPLLQFELFKDELRFVVNANEVLKARGQTYKKSKRYLVRNRCSTAVTSRVEVEPGEMFAVKRIDAFRKVYSKFDSESQLLTVEPGSSFQVQVEMSVTRVQILEIFDKWRSRGQRRGRTPSSGSSDLIVGGDVRVEIGGDGEGAVEGGKPPFVLGTGSSYSSYEARGSKFGIRPVDSYRMIECKARHWRSAAGTDATVRNEFVSEGEPPRELLRGEGDGEDRGEGEGGVAPAGASDRFESSCAVREELVLEQIGSVRQSVTLELRVFFPSLGLDPEVMDFGSVCVGRTSTRFASVVNLGAFATEVAVTWSGEMDEFSVSPVAASLPGTGRKSGGGAELTVRFAPKRPGYFKKTFKIYGNRELEFECSVLTVLGFGTWNEKYNSPETESSAKLPPISLPYMK